MIRNILSRFRLFWPRQGTEDVAPGSPAPSYETRLGSEKGFYAQDIDVHDLPEIFHYWSSTYLKPEFERFGFSDPNNFFEVSIQKRCQEQPGEIASVVSVGAGNCDVEVAIGRKLKAAGSSNFHFDCIEINPDMVRRAKLAAEAAGIAAHYRFLAEDFNRWQPDDDEYDIVMANQSLHHVVELEHLFDSVSNGLKPDGLFLTSDMIGRNGHQRWPEALAMVDVLWQQLPLSYRYNHSRQCYEKKFINHDCSGSGFEGIRAQDILQLLRQRFHFNLFLPYGNIAFVFVDRTFGNNYDPRNRWDRAFIDQVHALDSQSILEGTIKPTSMIAVMSLKPGSTQLKDPRLTPRFCTRDPETNIDSKRLQEIGEMALNSSPQLSYRPGMSSVISDGSAELPVTSVRCINDYELLRLSCQDEELQRRVFETGLLDESDALITEGHCFVCGGPQSFFTNFSSADPGEIHLGKNVPNWREELICSGCELNARARAIIHLMDGKLNARQSDSLYVREQFTPLHQFLKFHFDRVDASIYLGDQSPLGKTDPDSGIRNESLRALSFASRSFDFILSFDELQCIPDYFSALRECKRCLKGGGVLLFSVPFIVGSERNDTRAVVRDDGDIELLCPPIYSGDPDSTKGSLHFQHFGWQLLEELRGLGFSDVAAHFLWSADLAYLGTGQILFTAKNQA